jgi:formate/nitrite transporter
MAEVPAPQPTFDPLLPVEMAQRCEEVGERKASLDVVTTFVLACMAGVFISFGALFFTVVITDSAAGYGLTRFLGGVAFSLGLVLVIIGGAELFTGNTLIVMAWASRRVSTVRLLRNWTLVYAGNLVGAVATAGLVYLSGQWQSDNAAVGGSALTIANAKASLGFGHALVLGVLCNVLVTLAVWLSFSARSNVDKILGIVFPIAAFVAAGLEHSVANMYFLPLGLFLKHEPKAVSAAGLSGQGLANLTWHDALVYNLLPVTLGNLIGGGVLVAGVYWFIYLRPGRNAAPAPKQRSP